MVKSAMLNIIPSKFQIKFNHEFKIHFISEPKLKFNLELKIRLEVNKLSEVVIFTAIWPPILDLIKLFSSS